MGVYTKGMGIILLGGILFSCKLSKDSNGLTQDEIGKIHDDSLAIMANFSRQEECWNNGDLECYVSAYHPEEEVQTISSVGITKGMNNVLAQYQRFYPQGRMGNLHFDQMQLKRLSNDYYYVVGRFNLKYDVPDTLFQGWFSVLMKQHQDNWFMLSDHSS
jgi:hypothetical protein